MKITRAALLFLFLSALSLHAHGVHNHSHFEHGLLHPLSGWDHLLACALVGLLAAQFKKIWMAPAMFSLGLLGGFVLGSLLPGLPLAGAMVTLSILVLIALPAMDIRDLSTWLDACLVLIGMAHGYSHAAAGSSSGTFLIGLLAASIGLIGLFTGLVWTARRFGRSLKYQYLATAAGVLICQMSLYAWS